MISLKSISAGYNGKEALCDVSLSVNEGDFIALLGPNGSGKSTLLKIMAGQMHPISGEVKLYGKRLTDFTPRQRSRHMAYFPQSRPTPDMDVATLVSHGRFPRLGFGHVMDRGDTSAVNKAIAQTGLSGFENRLLSTLSGGERQRAYLAMLIAQEAEVLLLDEPSSFLDIVHQLEVMNILHKLNSEGKTIIFSAHDLPLAFSYAKRIVLFNNGTLISDALPEDMAASRSVVATFGVNLKKQNDGCLFRYVLINAEGSGK